jgi:hypothetical protein
MIIIDDYLNARRWDIALQMLSGPHWEYPPFRGQDDKTCVWRIFKPDIESKLGWLLYHSIPRNHFNPMKVKRVGVNGQTAGTDSHWHIDGPQGHTSLIHFSSPVWNEEWGGALVVGDDVVSYKPNRAVIFDSSLLHCPFTPTKPNKLRISIGLHLEPAESWEYKYIPR